MNIRLRHFIIILGMAVILFLLVFFSFGIPVLGSKPVIRSLEPSMTFPGDKILIQGDGFGKWKHRSRVFIAGQPLSSSAISSWSDNEIEIIAPDFNRSTLVSVRTLKGESPSQVLINANDFPVILPDPLLPGYPYISFVSPHSSVPGSVVEIHGQNFGNDMNRSQVMIPIKENYSVELFEKPDKNAYLFVDTEAILFWSDHLIQFVLPSGVVSGPILVETTRGYSNPFSAELTEKGYKRVYGEGKKWQTKQKFVVDQVAAYPENQLYLWIPAPVLTPEQRDVIQIGKYEEDTGLNRDNCKLLKLLNIETGSTYQFVFEASMTSYPFQVDVQPWLIPTQYDMRNPEVFKYLDAIPGMEADVFKVFKNSSGSIVRGETHPYTKARLLYDFLLNKFDPAEKTSSIKLKGIPDTSAIDSRNYALTFVLLARGAGIPARPVSGVYVTENGNEFSAVSHTWAEFYLENAGWFPVDPWLADKEQSPDKYWGKMDGNRITFSKDWSDTITVQAGGEPWMSDTYSLQKIYAESDGNIGAVRINWIIPTVVKP